MFAETSREPARLQFQLARDALRRKQRPLAHARGIAQVCIFLDQRHRKVCLYRNAGETERWIVRSARDVKSGAEGALFSASTSPRQRLLDPPTLPREIRS